MAADVGINEELELARDSRRRIYQIVQSSLGRRSSIDLMPVLWRSVGQLFYQLH